VALDGDQRRIEAGETAGEDDGERHVGYYWEPDGYVPHGKFAEARMSESGTRPKLKEGKASSALPL
jgi:hypothetical protein